MISSPMAKRNSFLLDKFGLRSERVLRLAIITMIFGVAFFTRLFSVVRYESIIHEFDPWFNFRATKKIVADGFYSFWDWFDDRSWYPLGRVVGGTIYPGLMVTAALFQKILASINFPLDIRNICVFLAPAFSGLTAYSLYLLTTELHSRSAGLFAAGFMAITPGYISRSVAGSYDNEAIAIFLLMYCFYAWVRAVKLGSALWGAIAGLVYFYMVSAWGGYVFITNMIPLHVFALLLLGRYSSKIYVAYCTWYAVGTISSFAIPFVLFAPVSTSEHMAAMGVFGLLQIVAATEWIRSLISGKHFRFLLRALVGVFFVAALSFLVVLTFSGTIAPWTGRFYSLWDVDYARKHIPIISSVSEHQPTSWASLFFDLHCMMFLFPVGVMVCFKRLRNEHIFLIVYSVLASYFAGVMVRLVLTLTPIVCAASGMAIGELLRMYSLHSIIKKSSNQQMKSLVETKLTNSQAESDSANGFADDNQMDCPIEYENNFEDRDQFSANKYNSEIKRRKNLKGNKKEFGSIIKNNINENGNNIKGKLQKNGAGNNNVDGEEYYNGQENLAIKKNKNKKVNKNESCEISWTNRAAVFGGIACLLVYYVQHCTWVTQAAYSSPSVVLSSNDANGGRVIIDDFREAYYWLRKNTAENATVMSWWDYGYQLAGMANRTTIVDNNTWNNTHIATVGRAMCSNEDSAYPILRALDVDYVLVFFGGLVGYSGDDINKFLWMVRIGQGVFPKHIEERKFFTERGEYRVDDKAPPTMRNSLMYKMSYYRFADIFGGPGSSSAIDRVRNTAISSREISFHTMDEAYTSQRWLVRIYKVRKPDFLARTMREAASFDKGTIPRKRAQKNLVLV